MAAKRRSTVGRLDQFGNIYKAIPHTIVADTLNYEEWNTNYSIKDGYGFVVHKIRYRILPAYLALLAAAGDFICVALCTRPDVVGVNLAQGNDVAIVDSFLLGRDLATAVGEQVLHCDIIHDFSNEPGGGRIIAPKPLYLLTFSLGCGAIVQVPVEICYTTIKLQAEVYRELYESMNPSA